MWVCSNCEAENNAALGVCNVCDTPRSERSDFHSGNPEATVSAKSSLTGWLLFVGVIAAISFGIYVATLNTDRGKTSDPQTVAQAEERMYHAASGSLDRVKMYLRDCKVCIFKSEAVVEINRFETNELARREENEYRAATSNLAGLLAYINSCQVCAFKVAAENYIQQLERAELAQREQQIYYSARGNADRLKAYLTTCKVCAFGIETGTEIAALEERRNHTTTFQIRSNHPNSVSLSFYSATDKSRQWPGNGTNYALNYSEIQTYSLTCEVGEKICYGAWVSGGPLSLYWGAGYGGKQNCQNCCVVCPAQVTAPFVLEPRDARQPPPTLTWHFRSNHPTRVELAFYSEDRLLKWPAGDQVYFIDGGSYADFQLSCQVGKRICYGAWPSGNINSSWGVGYGARGGCANCCYVCDGGETRLLLLNP